LCRGRLVCLPLCIYRHRNCLNHDFNKIKKISRINKPEVSRCHYVRARKMNLGNPDNRIEIVVQTMT
jgi:hypothetical protein